MAFFLCSVCMELRALKLKTVHISIVLQCHVYYHPVIQLGKLGVTERSIIVSPGDNFNYSGWWKELCSVSTVHMSQSIPRLLKLIWQHGRFNFTHAHNNIILNNYCWQDLAQLIPDIGTVRVQELPSYAGSRDSSRILYSTRTQLEQLSPPDYSRELSYDPGWCVDWLLLIMLEWLITTSLVIVVNVPPPPQFNGSEFKNHLVFQPWGAWYRLWHDKINVKFNWPWAQLQP